MFITTRKPLISLFVGRLGFKLRIYKRGYMVFLLTLWDTTNQPLVWLNWRAFGRGRQFGRALTVR